MFDRDIENIILIRRPGHGANQMLGRFAFETFVVQLFCYHHIGAIEIDHFLRIACRSHWTCGGVFRGRPILKSPADQIDKTDTIRDGGHCQDFERHHGCAGLAANRRSNFCRLASRLLESAECTSVAGMLGKFCRNSARASASTSENKLSNERP